MGIEKVEEQLKAVLTTEQFNIVKLAMKGIPTDFEKAAFARMIIDITVSKKTKEINKPHTLTENFLRTTMNVAICNPADLLTHKVMSDYSPDQYYLWVVEIIDFQRTVFQVINGTIIDAAVVTKIIAKPFREILTECINDQGKALLSKQTTTATVLLPYFLQFIIHILGERARAIILEEDQKTGESVMKLAHKYGDKDLIHALNQACGTNVILYAEYESIPTGYIYQGKQVNLSEFKSELSALPKTGEEFHRLVKTDWGKAVEYFTLYSEQVFMLLSMHHIIPKNFIEFLNSDIPISTLYFKKYSDSVFAISMQNIQAVLQHKDFFKTILTYAEKMELDAQALHISWEFITSFKHTRPAYPIHLQAFCIFFLGILTTKNGNKLSKLLEKINFANLDQFSRLPTESKKLLADEWKKNRDWLWKQNVFVYAKLFVTLFPEKHISDVPHRQRVFKKLLSEFTPHNNPDYFDFIQVNFKEKTEQQALANHTYSTKNTATKTIESVKKQLRANLDNSESTITIDLLEKLPTDFHKIAFGRLIIDIMTVVKQRTVRPAPNHEGSFIIQIMSLFMPEIKGFLQLGKISCTNLDIYTKWATSRFEVIKKIDIEIPPLAKQMPIEKIAEEFREILTNLIKGNIHYKKNYSITFQMLIPHITVFVIGILGERTRAIILDKDKKTGTSILHLACAYGDIDLVQKIITALRTNDPNSVKNAILEIDENKENALMHACGKKDNRFDLTYPPQEDVIKVLLAELGDQSERAIFATNKHLDHAIAIATSAGATTECLVMLANAAGSKKDALLGVLKMRMQHEAEAKAAPVLLGGNDVLRAKPQQAILPADEIFYSNDDVTPEGYVYQGKRVTIKEFKSTKSDFPKTVEEFHALIKSNWGMAAEFTITFISDITHWYISNNLFNKLLEADPNHIPTLLFKNSPTATVTYAINHLEYILNKPFMTHVFYFFEKYPPGQSVLLKEACQIFEPDYDIEIGKNTGLRTILLTLVCAIKNENGDKLKEFLNQISLKNLASLRSLPNPLQELIVNQWREKNKWLWNFNIFIYLKLLITLLPEQSKAMLTNPQKRSVTFTKILKEIGQASPADIKFVQEHFTQSTEVEQIKKELASKQPNKSNPKKPRISIVAAALAAAPAQPKPSAPAADAPTKKPKKTKPAPSIESDPPAASAAAAAAPKVKLNKSELIVQVTTLRDKITKQIASIKKHLDTWKSNKQRDKLEEDVEKIEKYLAENPLAKLEKLEEDTLFWKSLDMEGYERNLIKGIEKQVEKSKPDEQPAAAAATPKKERPKTRAEVLAEKRAEQAAAKREHEKEREKASPEKEEKSMTAAASQSTVSFARHHAGLFTSASSRHIKSDKQEIKERERPLYAAFDFVEDMAVCNIQFGEELKRSIPIEDKALYNVIRHFALQRHLFGCNNAQTRYHSKNKDKKDALEDIRNLMVYASWLCVSQNEMNENIQATLSTIKEFTDKLPEELAKERVAHTTRKLIAPDRIKAYLSSFRFEAAPETWADAPCQLVLDQTSLYQLNEKYHNKIKLKPVSQEDARNAYSAIRNIYIPLINRILSSTKKSQDQHPDKIKEQFPFHVDAIEMLLFICGQLGRVLKSFPKEWQDKDMKFFINTCLLWGNTRGTVSHEYERSSIGMILEGCRLAAKVNDNVSDCKLFKEEGISKNSPKPR